MNIPSQISVDITAIRVNVKIFCSGDVLLVKSSGDDHPTFMKIRLMLAEKNGPLPHFVDER